MFRLNTKKTAVGSKFSDFGGVFERAVNVGLAAGDLLCWGVLGVENGDFDFERRRSFAEHAAELAATQESELWSCTHFWRLWMS